MRAPLVLLRASALSSLFLLVTGACDPNRGQDAAADAPASDVLPGADAAGGNDAGSSCSFVGTWRGTVGSGPLAGQALTWTFAASTWSAAIATGSVQGTWSTSGSSLRLNDTGSTPAYLACPTSDQGSYTAVFDAPCAHVQLTAATETCDGRRAYADGIALTRQ